MRSWAGMLRNLLRRCRGSLFHGAGGAETKPAWAAGAVPRQSSKIAGNGTVDGLEVIRQRRVAARTAPVLRVADDVDQIEIDWQLTRSGYAELAVAPSQALRPPSHSEILSLAATVFESPCHNDTIRQLSPTVAID